MEASDKQLLSVYRLTVYAKEGDNILKYINQMRQVRKQAKMSQKLLAEKLGVSVMTIRNYESGKSVPDVYTAYMIAEYISCHNNDFYYIGVPDLFRVVEFPDFI